MLTFENFSTVNKLERMLMRSFVSQSVESVNCATRAFGATGDELNGVLRVIKSECAKTKKTNTGSIEANFEFEINHEKKLINIWHTKITTGERDELVSTIKNNS